MILSLFLGLMVVVLVGAGVHTLYPSPSRSESELQQLNDQQKALDKARLAAGSISPSHEALYKKVSDKIATEKKALQAGRDSWVRNTSIILIAFGTLFVGASFAVASQMLAISNGLLLGGLFTLWYGAARSFTGGDSNSRVVVVGVVLFMTLAVGYMKFLRARRVDGAEPAPLEPTPPAPPAA